MNKDDLNAIAVENLQRYLRRLSYEDNHILPPPVDGIFDTATEEALIEFQREYGLPVTGRADRETWELLYAEYERLIQEEDHVERIDLFPSSPEHYVTTIGEESAFILLLQWLLSELSVVYDSLADVKPSGVYDEATAAAVRELNNLGENDKLVAGQILKLPPEAQQQ